MVLSFRGRKAYNSKDKILPPVLKVIEYFAKELIPLVASKVNEYLPTICLILTI